MDSNSTQTLDAASFRELLSSAFESLQRQRAEINDLNVFPVPDGDTGTNMCATFQSGMNSLNDASESNIGALARSFATGCLYGARGNSGVILSQFFAGFAAGLDSLDQANVADVSKALKKGVEKAYSAVNKPVEGTLLTVARLSAIEPQSNETFPSYFSRVQKEADAALRMTPDLLDVLKEANVVDSGGAGYCSIISGFVSYFSGEPIAFKAASASFSGGEHAPTVSLPALDFNAFDENSHMGYGYCTEFILQLLKEKNGVETFHLADFIHFLEEIGGDSIVAVQNETRVKIHVHTKQPWKAIEKALEYGEFITFKMENMSLQHNEVLKRKAAKAKPHAVVAVAPSREIGELLQSYGVDEIVLGGQTMNPSASDLLKAYQQANADSILVFPNNSNIYMAAKQAEEMYQGKGKIQVVACDSFASCFLALQTLDWSSSEDPFKQASARLEEVHTLCFAPSTRETTINGVKVEKDSILGIADHKVIVAEKTLSNAFHRTCELLDLNNCSAIYAFYGADLSKEERLEIQETFQGFDMVDFADFNGNQPVYPLVIAFE